MVVPDFELICEIMLVAEGFQEARILARKFITLYTLCKELLSKQDRSPRPFHFLPLSYCTFEEFQYSRQSLTVVLRDTDFL